MILRLMDGLRRVFSFEWSVNARIINKCHGRSTYYRGRRRFGGVGAEAGANAGSRLRRTGGAET